MGEDTFFVKRFFYACNNITSTFQLNRIFLIIGSRRVYKYQGTDKFQDHHK